MQYTQTNNSIALKHTPTSKSDGDSSWLLLKLYSSYRVVLCLVLLISLYINNGLHHNTSQSYLILLLLYFLSAIIFSLCAINKLLHFTNQVILQIFIDIISLSILAYPSTQANTAILLLIFPVIAAGSILSPGKISFLYSSIATIAILSQELSNSFKLDNLAYFTQGGIISLGFFTTALIINYLCKTMLANVALAKTQTKTLVQLEHLNALIIKKIHFGMIVVDCEQSVLLINQAAKILLNLGNLEPKHPSNAINLNTIAPALSKLTTYWQANKLKKIEPTHLVPFGLPLNIEITQLGGINHALTLILLEHIQEHESKFKNLHLHALGRLTGSIAHELRNPLSAINHAAQLLAESPNVHAEDIRLCNIIHENSTRTNSIIESILSLSSAKIKQNTINLEEWLKKFIKSYQYKNTIMPIVKLDIIEPCIIHFDLTHLQQVIINLLDNAIRHSLKATNLPYVKIKLTKNTILISDNGEPISKSTQNHLFEPFFSTETQGVGLGLFISRELCLANSATLYYDDSSADKGFYIKFN